uniref:POTRA domain-containing protein n=2 Tax=Kappaphycus TaxID=38543 RepID=A0A8E7PGU6_9FLOR|nr:hypothetical protein [Kappaphycus striatus]
MIKLKYCALHNKQYIFSLFKTSKKTKFIIFIFNIYHMLYQLKYLLVFILSFIYSILLSKSININVAFNANIIHNEKIKKIHTQGIQVQLEGCKNILFSSILPKSYTVLHKYHYHHIKIIKLIEYLQNSGFLKKIEYFIIYSNNIIYVILNINTNPIIKKIEIIRWNQLKIPHKILIHLFKSQIGLPANYKKINNSIKKIYDWYKERGFERIYIQLIQNKKSKTIKLHIFEGKIKSNQFFFYSKYNINHILIHNIEKIIEQKLDILPGSLFNIKILKKNIKYLKNIRLIENLKYDIINGTEGLIIKIKYSIPIESQGYFYNKYLIVNGYENQIKSYVTDKDTIKNKYLIALKNIKSSFSRIFYYQCLGFKIFLPNLNSKYYNFIVNIVLTKKVPEVNINFFYPNLEITQSILNNLKINIFHKIYYIKTLYPFHYFQTKYFNIKNILQIKTLLHSSNIYVLYNYLMNNEIFIIYGIRNMHNIYIKKFINLKNHFIDKHIKSTNKILQTIIQQKLFTLNLQTKYHNLDMNDKFKLGKSIFIESIFFIFIKQQQINIIHSSLSIKYYQTFTTTNLLPYIKKSIIIIFSEISLLNNKNTMMFDSCGTNLINIYLELFDKKIMKTYIHYLSHIEYHMQMYDFLSTYFFYHKSNKLHYMYKYYYHTQNIGLGIQFNIPINNIPKVRFEYGINIYADSYYQMRLSYPYII